MQARGDKPIDSPEHDRTRRALASGAAIMVAATFGSALLGAVRMMLFAWRFGAEGPPNAFMQASRLPELLYFLIAGGALRAGFVPVFTGYIARGQHDRAWRTFSSLFWLLLLFGGSLVAAGVAFAPQLAVVVGPAWVKENPELLPLCAQLMRLMFPAQLSFVVGGLLMGTLNSLQHFFWPALAPIVYNCIFIAAILAANGPEHLWVVALAMPVGSLLANNLMQIPALRRFGARLSFVLDFSDEGLRRTVKLAGPVVLGLAIAELNYTVLSILATFADPDRGPTTLAYANFLWRTPTRIIGSGIAIALFPILAYRYSRGELSAYRKDLQFSARAAVALALPATVALIGLRYPLIALIYQRGRFDALATEQVAHTLLYFSLGIVPLTLLYLVARAFYAMEDTRTPVAVGAISFAFCAALGWVAKDALGVSGLALSMSLATAVNASALWVILSRRIGGLGGRAIAASALRHVPGLAALGTICYVAAEWSRGHPSLASWAIATVAGGGAGALAYLLWALLVGSEELKEAWRLLAKRPRPSADDEQI